MVRLLAAWMVFTLVVSSATACSGTSRDRGRADGTADGATTSASTAPVTPRQRGEFTGIRDVGTGDCFDVHTDSRSLTRAVWAIDCDTAHDYEVFDTFDFEGRTADKGSTYPGTAVVQNQAEVRCHEGFESFVGTRWTVSDLDIRTWWPSETSWDRGDRTILCALTSSTGTALIGTQRGAAH